jgi:hypothetical protein
MAATHMRVARLKKKLEVNCFDGHDLHFLEKMLEYSDGKTDLRGVAGELGMKVPAVRMR